MALQMGFGLFDLGEDILHLVITQLSAQSPISMCAFARVSKYCNELVNPVIWRSVRLGKGPRTHLTIEGFLAKRDSSKYVRDIVVQGFGQDKGSPSATELKRMILGVKQLSSFSWNANTLIPEEVLSALEEQWPNLNLQVVVRKHEYDAKKIDTRLLSSRLLYTLDYSIRWRRSSLHHSESDNDVLSSELDKIDEILSRSPRLRVLNLGLDWLNTIVDLPSATEHDKTAAVTLPDGLFPNIHSLIVPARDGHAAESPASTRILTSLLVTRFTKWKSVKELHLRGLCPQYTFGELEGRVPNLKSLEVVFPSHYSGKGSLDPNMVGQFIMSLESPEVFKIWDMEQEQVNEIWPAILKHHGTLKTLELYTAPDWSSKSPVWSAKQLSELQGSKLSHLGIQLSIANTTIRPPREDLGGDQASQLDNTFEDSAITILPHFTQLRTLKISINIPFEKNLFSEEFDYDRFDGDVRPPTLNIEMAKEVATDLFLRVFLKDPRANLRELELCLVRLDVFDRGQTAQLRTSVWVRKLPTVGEVTFKVEIQQESYR